jgi:hypothetical protein
MNALPTITGTVAVSPASASAPAAPVRREVNASDAQGFSSMMAEAAQPERSMAASPLRMTAPAGAVAQPVNALFTGGDMQSPGLGDRILIGLQKIDDSVTGKMQDVHKKLEKFESEKTELSMVDGMKLMVDMTSIMAEVEFFSSGVKKLDSAVDSLLHTS